jgi:hypothetical protein
MHATFTRRDLTAADIVVLQDLVRFGVLAEDQIARRYGDSLIPVFQMPLLVAGSFVEPWAHIIEGPQLFSATALGARVAQCGLKAMKPSLEHVRHDVAVVDLADYLLSHEPGTEWCTERELSRVIGESARRSRSRGSFNGPGHRPDGLLLKDDLRIAIELEHSSKGDYRYASICRWFAQAPRVDGVRWYADDPKVISRIKRVNHQHGFDRDIDVTFHAFPPGLAVRQWVRA